MNDIYRPLYLFCASDELQHKLQLRYNDIGLLSSKLLSPNHILNQKITNVEE
jgi:hypothetical protein